MAPQELHRLRSTALPVVSILVVVTALIASLTLSGSPAEERRRWEDGVRVEHLSTIVYDIDRYYQTNGKLPKVLKDMPLPSGYGSGSMADPLTKKRYDYRPIGPKEYELCATFVTDTSRETTNRRRSSHPWYDNPDFPFWKHRAGRECYRLKAEPLRWIREPGPAE